MTADLDRLADILHALTFAYAVDQHQALHAEGLEIVARLRGNLGTLAMQVRVIAKSYDQCELSRLEAEALQLLGREWCDAS